MSPADAKLAYSISQELRGKEPGTKRRGRPKGSKNKKQSEPSIDQKPQKRKRRARLSQGPSASDSATDEE
jgi:hypothetical protein